ncbi:MAG: hypothetical protein WCE62_19495 [Polyangiales bacterium]
MIGPRRNHRLPAGVLPARPPGRAEDLGSRVRAKAPPPVERPPGPSVPLETPAERARSLVDELLRRRPDGIAPIVRRLLALGNFALEELAERFPGPLWRPSPSSDSGLLRPAEVSAIAVAIATFEDEAIPYLARLMRQPSPKVRYYAASICGAHEHTLLIPPLARLSLDEDRDCRRVALHLLSTYQHDPQYRRALSELRHCASDVAQPLAVRRRVISALTQLRDEASLTLFVNLLADSDRGIATASRVGLRVLTAHDFGFARDAWLRWLSERGHDIRIQWLIEGLGDSRGNIRVLASRELWHQTRLLEPLSEASGRDEFLAAQQSYKRWWTRTHFE